MGINWIRLYELNEKNNKLSGSKFEELVLCYLNEYYREYDWEKTKSSWDNNHDFISLVLENIWAEAKYKKNCTALKKSDIDPTMMSGFLDGNIEVVFFITNGYLPKTLMERIKQAEKMHFFHVICITKVQLEYWLYLYPDIYQTYFDEELDLTNKCSQAALIAELEIVDPTNSNSNLLALKQELYLHHFYVLFITVETNTLSEMSILDNDYPFSFINAPGYENYESIRVQPGIHHFKLLIYTADCYNGVAELKYRINNETQLSYAFRLNICMDQDVKLTYSQQFVYKEKIIRILSAKNSNERLLTLGGEVGFGKTFLQKSVMQHFYAIRQIMYFNFYPKEDYRNAIEICRLLIYINFGEIVNYFKRGANFDTINYYKELLTEKFDFQSGDLNLILDTIDGCYDEIHAHDVKKRIEANPQFINKIILHRIDPVAHLALLDNTEQLHDSEYNTLKEIINYSIRFNSTRFLVNSKGKERECDFYLTGLTMGDIQNSLKANFITWTTPLIDVICKEMSSCPEAFIDSIEALKQYLNQEDNIDTVANYIYLTDSAENMTLYKPKVLVNKQYLEILSFIYLFENGISHIILRDMNISDELLNDLRNKQYIKFIDRNVLAYSRLYRNIFLKENLNKCTNYVIDCLKMILRDAAKYEELIFLPEVHEKYIKIVKNNTIDISADLLERMRTYSYSCDYKNMYAYGKIAYYYLNQKKSVELSESDYLLLFYYGISLLHCDRKRGAIEVFRKIKNNTSIESTVNIMASCELYNNLYNLFQIDQLEGEIKVTLIELERKINCLKEENECATLDMRIAYSTCMNRYMMILFMLDRISDASKIFEKYIEYNKTIPNSLYLDKYKSMLGEWFLDYARGISCVCSISALVYYKKSIRILKHSKNEKRYILSEMDLSFWQCVYFDDFNEIENLHQQSIKLQKKKFVNEYYRGIIRENLCKLVQYFKDSQIAASKGIITIALKMKEEALNIQLDSMLYVKGRLAYQTGIYFAVLDSIIGEFEEAQKYLERNLHMVVEVGASYTNIVLHNLKYFKRIKTIEWGITDYYLPYSFILDPRIW